MLRLLCYTCVFLLAASFPGWTDSLQPGRPRVKRDLIGGRPVVDVFLNGNGPYRFLLDTGGQSNQVEAGLARTLGLAPTFRVELGTPTGTLRVPAGRIGQVSLGGVEAANQ